MSITEAPQKIGSKLVHKTAPRIRLCLAEETSSTSRKNLEYSPDNQLCTFFPIPPRVSQEHSTIITEDDAAHLNMQRIKFRGFTIMNTALTL